VSSERQRAAALRAQRRALAAICSRGCSRSSSRPAARPRSCSDPGIKEALRLLGPADAQTLLLLSFGTTGDVDYLHHPIAKAEVDVEELRRTEAEKDGLPVAYFVFRLTPRKA